MAQWAENLPVMQETQEMQVWRLGSGRSPGGGHGNLPQYSCLENTMDRAAWWATVHTVTKSQTCLSMHAQRKMSCYWIGSHYLLLIKSIHTLSVLIQKLPLIRMPEIWGDGLSVFQNYLWSLCSATITFKGNREAISVHHWDEGSELSPSPTVQACVQACWLLMIFT